MPFTTAEEPQNSSGSSYYSTDDESVISTDTLPATLEDSTLSPILDPLQNLSIIDSNEDDNHISDNEPFPLPVVPVLHPSYYSSTPSNSLPVPFQPLHPTPPPPFIPNMTAACPIEMKLCIPAEFNGDRSKTKEFVLDSKMYIRGNSDIYDDDKKKILFVLSHMRGGTAGPWKEDYFNTALNSQTGFGTYTAFMNTVESAFSPSDVQGDARTKLKTLHMTRGMTADNYIAEF